jgi:hypothetical protein
VGAAGIGADAGSAFFSTSTIFSITLVALDSLEANTFMLYIRSLVGILRKPLQTSRFTSGLLSSAIIFSNVNA